MRRNSAQQVRPLHPLQSLPALPNSLLRDEIPLPVNYQPGQWAFDLVAEWRAGPELAAVGAYATMSVLIEGMSGVGKTTAGRWIARELELPVFAMLLSASLESYLGATGRKVESALRYAAEVPSVLLLDEVDAVATARGSESGATGGEMNRVANSLIQSLDHWHGTPRRSLLIATTNMIEMIDPAIRRRFELEVSVPAPTSAELSIMAGVPIPESLKLSHGEMTRLVLQAKRKQVVYGVDYKAAMNALVESMATN